MVFQHFFDPVNQPARSVNFTISKLIPINSKLSPNLNKTLTNNSTIHQWWEHVHLTSSKTSIKINEFQHFWIGHIGFESHLVSLEMPMRPAAQLVSLAIPMRPAAQPASEPASRPASQPASEPASQRANQPASHPSIHPGDKS